MVRPGAKGGPGAGGGGRVARGEGRRWGEGRGRVCGRREVDSSRVSGVWPAGEWGLVGRG